MPQQFAGARPDPDTEPTRVAVNFVVLDIQDIDTAMQTFKADFFMRLKWRDTRLAEANLGRSLALCEIDINELWNPRVVVDNRDRLGEQLRKVARVSSDGIVTYLQRFSGTLSGIFNLEDYPFDTQTLKITTGSVAYGPKDVLLEFDEASTARSDRFSLVGWTLGRAHGRTSAFLFDRPEGPESYSRLDYEMRARRNVTYAIWKQIFPLILIVCMSWAVFWIDPMQLGTQVGIASSSILTLVAFLFSFQSDIPHVSYLTRLDYFVFGSLSLVFLAFVEAITTALLSLGNRQTLALRLDRWSRYVFPLMLIGLSYFSFWL